MALPGKAAVCAEKMLVKFHAGGKLWGRGLDKSMLESAAAVGR
jgi:hypothetical protein